MRLRGSFGSDLGLDLHDLLLFRRVYANRRLAVVHPAKVAPNVSGAKVVAVKVDVAVRTEAKATDLFQTPVLRA